MKALLKTVMIFLILLNISTAKADPPQLKAVIQAIIENPILNEKIDCIPRYRPSNTPAIYIIGTDNEDTKTKLFSYESVVYGLINEEIGAQLPIQNKLTLVAAESRSRNTSLFVFRYENTKLNQENAFLELSFEIAHQGKNVFEVREATSKKIYV
ncbi:MAG: hypothetical protein LAT68_10505 [Cyclobacteriaceae bacterium]|nr:hypothetical protein [Cyclobacteriaceae bacterium]MCH8516746.1 hypothetical protein [Cyclobacteriaceae bacterium]